MPQIRGVFFRTNPAFLDKERGPEGRSRHTRATGTTHEQARDRRSTKASRQRNPPQASQTKRGARSTARRKGIAARQGSGSEVVEVDGGEFF